MTGNQVIKPGFKKSYISRLNKAAILYCHILFFATTVCCFKKTTAQIPSAWSYEQFNSSHGLPSSETISLAKDSQGFLWVGTPSGLSRYDGYEFHNYPRTKNNELIGFVNVLASDAQNRLWIGSDAGLFCYVNNEIVKISASASSPQGVNDILPEKDGTIWLATENGPASIHINDIDITGTKKAVLSNYILPQWNFKNSDRNIVGATLIKKAGDGTVYIAQSTGLFRLSKNTVEPVYQLSDYRDRILSVFPINRSKVFFNSIETEIHKIENGVHTNIQHAALYQPGVDDELEGIWHQGTYGLYYFHPETAVVSRFINTIDHGITWPSAMLKDDNFFWVASHEGLFKIKPSLFHNYNTSAVLPSHKDFYSFLQLRNGNLLVGSNRGNLLQIKDIGFSLLWKNIVPAAEIKCMYEDERSWLWMGSGYQGLVTLQNNKPQAFTEESGLHDNSFSRFLKTTSGKLYAVGDKGMSEIIVAPDNTVSFKKYYYLPGITKYAKFFAGIEAPDGSIWIGGEEGIFHLLNDSLQRFIINNSQVSVKDMLRDNEGNIWIATDGEGILKCVFNSKNELEAVRQFTGEDGLTSLHYLTLLADKENNIWAGSILGLTFIGQQGKYKDRILNFDETDGFTKPGYYSMSLYQDRTGIIWAGSSLGIVSFIPDEFFLSAAFPQMYITGIKQREKSGAINDLSGRNKFSYRNNSFNFSFVALDYASQKSIRYFYRLDGLDTNWVSAGSLRSVSYENLSPGHYSFHVKALNNKGIWSRQDAVYSFSIATPFRQTWWFRILLTLAAITAITIYIRRRINAVKAKAAIRQQVTELELKALRAQMNPHFIFNAMNSIQQFTLKNDVDNANLYISKFSTLLRKVLHSSQQNFITLEEEMEQLNLYLEIEKQRLGDDFTYSVQADEEIEEDAVKIPGMLVQPFVENALKHGLLLKEGVKNLSVAFGPANYNELLVTVTDNGIGRLKAEQIKAQQEKLLPHQSMGIELVEERLRLLGYSAQNTATAEFTDLYDEQGLPAGTRVSIRIPLSPS